MTKNERLKLYERGVKAWGLVAQYDQYIEESAELIVAINKYKRKVLFGEYENKSEIEENLVEEIADTFMCLELLIKLNGEEKFEKMLEQKMLKFKSQIEKQEQKNKQ